FHHRGLPATSPSRPAAPEISPTRESRAACRLRSTSPAASIFPCAHPHLRRETPPRPIPLPASFEASRSRGRRFHPSSAVGSLQAATAPLRAAKSSPPPLRKKMHPYPSTPRLPATRCRASNRSSPAATAPRQGPSRQEGKETERSGISSRGASNRPFQECLCELF